MAIIHMSFNENDPDDASLYEKLQAIGRKNRTALMKVLVRNVIDQYGELFEPKYAGALIALLQRGSPPPAIYSPVQPVKRTEIKPGKKRGRKPKNRELPAEKEIVSPVKEEPVVNDTDLEKPEPVIEDTSQDTQPPANKNFYQMMGDYLEDGVYNT